MRKTLAAVAIVAASVTSGVAVAAPVKALEPDPIPKITCVSLVIHLGETLHCTVTETGGFVPADRIVYVNPRTRSQIPVWNGQNQTFDIAYTPSLGEVGRTETLIATIYQAASGHLVRPSSGSTAFQVVT